MFFSAKLWLRVFGVCLALGSAGACAANEDDDDSDSNTTPGDGGDGGTTNGGRSGSSNGGTAGSQVENAGAPAAAGSGGLPGGSGAAGGEGGVGADGGVAGQGPGGTGNGTTEPAPPDTARETTGPLVFQVTSARSPAVPGEHATYVVTVGNTGNLDVDGVKVVLNVPTGLSFDTTDDSVPSSSNCGNGICSASEEATWTLGTLEPYSTKTIVVSPSVTGTVGDGDTISAPFRLNATGQSSVALTKSLSVREAADAELSIEIDADPVVPGQLVTLTLNAGQISTDWIDATSLKLELPGILELEEISDSGSADADGSIVWPLGEVDVGTSFRRTVTARVSSNAPAGNVSAARASLVFDGGLEIDNVAEVQSSIIAEPQPLALSVTSLFGPARAGGLLGYQINALNTGRRALNEVKLMVPVPPGLSFATDDDAEPNSSNCGNGICTAHELATWTLGTLAAGTSRTITLSPSVNEDLAGDGSIISLPFLLRAQGMQDVNAMKSDPVFTSADSQLILGTEVSPVTPGQTFTYELSVGQSGATALHDATLTLFLPADVSITSASNSGNVDGQVVTWPLADIALGATLRRTVEVTASEDALPGATLLARAELSYDDDLQLDASSEYAVAIVAEPLALEAGLVVPTASVTPAAIAACTTTIANISNRSVDGVTAAMRVQGMSFDTTDDSEPNSSNCGNGICTSGEQANWTIGNIPVGGDATIGLFPVVSSTLQGGSLVTVRQLINATDLGATIQLQRTILTKP